LLYIEYVLIQHLEQVEKEHGEIKTELTSCKSDRKKQNYV